MEEKHGYQAENDKFSTQGLVTLYVPKFLQITMPLTRRKERKYEKNIPETDTFDTYGGASCRSLPVRSCRIVCGGYG